MIKWQKIRKKPVEVEAFRLTREMCNKLKGENKGRFKVNIGKHECTIHTCIVHGHVKKIIIPTLEGDMVAGLGDWIIKGVNGEIYPCKPDIFEKTYDVLESEISDD